MSVEALAIVLHHSKAKGTAKLVLVGIANHDGDGGAWPSMRTLAKYANVDVRNARRAVEKLKELKEVRVDVQAGGTADMHPDERPNMYHVLVSCPPWCDRTKHHRDTRDPADRLWKNPRANSSGGAELPGGPPGGIAPLTTPTEHATPGLGDSTTDRARGDEPSRVDEGPCTTCGAPDVFTHDARQARLVEDDRHRYAPRRR